MRITMTAAIAATLILATTSAPARACGDPSVGTGHGGSCPVGQAARGAVLVVLDPTGSEGSLLRDPGLPGVLSASGFTPRVVSGLEAAKQALSQQSFSVVLATVESAPALKTLIDGSADRPGVLPVVHKGSKEAASEAQKTYGAVVTSPTRARTLVAAIEAVAGS